jgi:hypothetical protein
MKTNKIILIIVVIALIFSCNLSFSQLKVNGDGWVNIGSEANPFSTLQVTGNALFSTCNSNCTNSCAYIRGNNGYSSATNPDYSWWFNDQAGIFHPAADVIGFTVGGSETMRIKKTNGVGQVAIGGDPISLYKLTIYGDGYASSGVWTASDERYKKNIKPIDEALNKILKLNGKSYEYKTDEFKNFNFEKGTSFGFIAQDLSKILPEAVKIDSSGYYAVNYDMLIPILVEAIKEQHKIIDELKTKIDGNSDKLKSAQISTDINSVRSSIASLSQNAPNPFDQSTEIAYYLPESTQNAVLSIYNMNGNQLKKYVIDQMGQGTITINASELKSGMYLYSLIADGKEIDTKRMIITE